jgi:RNase adaptor protein for sRNA GlmZ degradation
MTAIRALPSSSTPRIDGASAAAGLFDVAFAAGDATKQKSRLAITLVSFGFKHGIPMVPTSYSTWFLPNRTSCRGAAEDRRDRAMIRFMEDSQPRRSAGAAEQAPQISDSAVCFEGRAMTIGIGCTSGSIVR